MKNLTQRREGAKAQGVLKAPFPWFGGKSRAAHIIWPRFGDVRNYVEPFAGSVAVLLRRPRLCQKPGQQQARAHLV